MLACVFISAGADEPEHTPGYYTIGPHDVAGELCAPDCGVAAEPFTVTGAVRILDSRFVRLALERRLEIDVEYRLEARDILGECGLTADILSAVVTIEGPAGRS